MLEGSHCRQGLCNGIGFDQSWVRVSCMSWVLILLLMSQNKLTWHILFALHKRYSYTLDHMHGLEMELYPPDLGLVKSFDETNLPSLCVFFFFIKPLRVHFLKWNRVICIDMWWLYFIWTQYGKLTVMGTIFQRTKSDEYVNYNKVLIFGLLCRPMTQIFLLSISILNMCTSLSLQKIIPTIAAFPVLNTDYASFKFDNYFKCGSSSPLIPEFPIKA